MDLAPLQHDACKVSTGLNNFDFDDVSRELYEFTWDYFCDWYIEIAKIQMSQDPEGQTKKVLHTILEGLMRALHPIIAFHHGRTLAKLPKSELYSQLMSVMFAPYPRPDDRFLDESAEEKMNQLMRVIRAIRDMRATFSVPAKAETEVTLVTSDTAEADVLKLGLPYHSEVGAMQRSKYHR